MAGRAGAAALGRRGIKFLLLLSLMQRWQQKELVLLLLLLQKPLAETLMVPVWMLWMLPIALRHLERWPPGPRSFLRR